MNTTPAPATNVATYVPDASTLVNNINAIKQWVYSGAVQILVPLSVMDQVEELYKVSIAPKEPTKEHQQRKSWGKMPRKEHPLFDINPRIAWEFLSRARSEKGEAGVTFQREEEKFTQWEKNRDHVPEVTSPSPPTSYTNALLRKLNIQEPSEPNGVQGPTKPKLVAKSGGDHKSPWTHNQVPTITESDVPKDLRSLFSCILWHIHEYRDEPLNSRVIYILSDNPNTESISKRLSINSRSSSDVHQMLAEATKSLENRSERGRLELDFSRYTQDLKSTVAEVEPLNVPNLDTTPAQVSEQNGANGNITLSEENRPLSAQNDISRWREPFESNINASHSRESLQTFMPFGNSGVAPKSNSQAHAHPERPYIQAPIGTGRLKGTKDVIQITRDKEPAAPTSSLMDSLIQGSSPDVPDELATKAVEPPKSISPIGERKKPQEESELDSDEEIIVFKARRASGRPKTPAETPRSRPATSHSHTVSNEGLKPTRSPIISTLKPQSPVFTPGQTYVPAVTGPIDQVPQKSPISRVVKPSQNVPPTGPAQDRAANVSPPNTTSPARSPQRRAAAPRRPRADIQQRHPSHDHLQHQSRMIIQRQREVIERQMKAAPKPPPRQIQMEPTENPTVIDPDAFDRSYVVQHPTSPQTTTNGRGAPSGRGGRRRSPKGKESPKQNSKKLPDKSPAAEADVDYVLKSGQPRGSTRGKGRLWVP